MIDFDKATALTSKLAQESTAKNKKKWVFENLRNIEAILDTGMKTKEYVSLLNDEAGLELSVSLFKKYLSQARNSDSTTVLSSKKATAKESRTASPVAKPKSTGAPKQSRPADTRPPTSLKPSIKGQEPKRLIRGYKDTPEPDWTDTEHLVGYRLEECIRNHVSVVDGKIVRTFPVPTMLTAEQRNALARLRSVVYPG